MLGIGHFPELIIVLVIALIIFGPGKLPEIGRSLGKGLRGFQQASRELQSTLNGPFEDINAPITSSPPTTPPQPGAGSVPVTTVEHTADPQAAGGPAHVAEHASDSVVVPTGTTVVEPATPIQASAAPSPHATDASVSPASPIVAGAHVDTTHQAVTLPTAPHAEPSPLVAPAHVDHAQPTTPAASHTEQPPSAVAQSTTHSS